MSDIRDRALRAAKEQAAQRHQEASAAAKREQRCREQQLADAEALCEQELSVKAKFAIEMVVLGPEGGEVPQIVTYIEGVRVNYYPESTQYGGRVAPPKLSHDLARLGADIKWMEEARRKKQVEEAAFRKARTCDWCGEIATSRSHYESHAEAVAAHKKWDCRKAPWWRRL